MHEEKTIFIYRVAHLGDAVVTLPALWAIRNYFDTQKMYLITDSHSDKQLVSSWAVFGPSNIFAGVFRYNQHKFDFFALFKLMMRVRFSGNAVLYYLTPIPITKFKLIRDFIYFRFICGVHTIIGLDKSCLSDDVVNAPNEVDRLRSVVSHSGVPLPATVDFRIPFSKSIKDSVLCRYKFLAARHVVIALGIIGKSQTQRWPEHNYIQVCKHVLKEYPNVHFCVIGGEMDAELIDGFNRHVGTRSHRCISKSVLETAEILRLCSFYIGNDTGIMHLSAAVGLPCIAIFSARSIKNKWYPYGHNHKVFRQEVSCSNCQKNVCQHIECLQRINPLDVLAAVEDAIITAQSTVFCRT